MTALLYLIPIAIALSFTGLLAFFWATRNGQFEDLDGAPHRILKDDDENL
jgi:cbb3-type cytochrome oxidase maturation protein